MRQRASRTANDRATNSASKVDWAGMGCILLVQLMDPSASVNTAPDVEFLVSQQPVKSEYSLIAPMMRSTWNTKFPFPLYWRDSEVDALLQPNALVTDWTYTVK